MKTQIELAQAHALPASMKTAGRAENLPTACTWVKATLGNVIIATQPALFHQLIASGGTINPDHSKARLICSIIPAHSLPPVWKFLPYNKEMDLYCKDSHDSAVSPPSLAAIH